MLSTSKLVLKQVTPFQTRLFSTSFVVAQEDKFAKYKSKTSWVKQKEGNGSNLLADMIKKERLAKDQAKPAEVHPRFSLNFSTGTAYDPFDFSLHRLRLTKKQTSERAKVDVFEQKNIDPLDLYAIPEILQNYITAGGKIYSQKATGLSRRNHKRLAKAIKRSRSNGFLSPVSRDVSSLPIRRI